MIKSVVIFLNFLKNLFIIGIGAGLVAGDEIAELSSNMSVICVTLLASLALLTAHLEVVFIHKLSRLIQTIVKEKR